MKKLFTFLSRANNNSVGLKFNHRRVSSIYSMLTLVAIMLMVTQGVKARTFVYDFRSLAEKAYELSGYQNVCPYNINMGDSYTGVSGLTANYGASTTYGDVTVDFSKFAFRMDMNNNKGWLLRCENNIGGLQFTTAEARFVITNLRPDDEITLYCKASRGDRTATITFLSGNAQWSNGTQINDNTTLINHGGDTDEQQVTFKASENGDIVLTSSTAWYTVLTGVVINRPDRASYSYDPAKETYDLTQSGNSNASISNNEAGFTLGDNQSAYYIVNPGCVLNHRVAIVSTTGLSWNNGLQFNSSDNNWYNYVSISNLKADDRVRITYSSGDAYFASAEGNVFYASVFFDASNDGIQDETEDITVSGGSRVESAAWYTMLENGHLDLVLTNGVKITKIEIVSDHQAQMIDKDNDYGTSTSYFNTTGQLEAKHHIVPGGLHVYVGNDNDTQHAEVVSSDQGPVSFVYDEEHYKMARQIGNSVSVMNKLPSTGTFYKFVPEVSGKMWVKFKAVSVKYGSYNNGIPGNGVLNNGTPNETITNTSCPYYLMVEQNGSFTSVGDAHYYPNQNNGDNGYFGSPDGNPSNGENDGITVERGKTYYLYGWWQDNTDSYHLTNYSCGVAELIEVTFLPNQMVEPLAKWVESGTTEDESLATVKGYNTVKIKKKSANIASCEPYIENGTLKIRNITFVDENKGGGTILIKIGNPNIDADPVFAYTIAYNAGYNEKVLGQDGNGATVKRSEGHTWNFSDQPLKGLKWNNKNSEADEVVFGPYFNNFATADKDGEGVPTNGVNSNSLLYEEMNKTNPDGSKQSDWTFNYRVKKNGSFMDPRFLNNWDMEGDNADMMWDTEGIIINAGSSQSCIFDEFCLTNNRVIDHTNKTQADPDRYVGFLEGGEFIIPQLKKDDRVIVYMGSGGGSGAQAMQFHITNAKDALYKDIDPDDFYYIGGSQWNVPNGHNDPYYRGCYHFFAKADGDMTFTMAGGSMCKLYSIQIYRGERIETNSVQENNSGGYTLLAGKDQSGNVTSTETKSWTLHYRGKGEQVAEGDADGSGKFQQKNEVIASSGNIANTSLSVLTGGESNSRIGITYTNQGEIGMLRVRVKCMEYNQNYVTDYSDRNLTLALHETKLYPYTWDFTDMIKNDADKGYLSGQDIADENTNYDGTDVVAETKGRDLSIWDENGSSIIYGPTWGYTNQNMLFENSKGINGNQLYANDKVIPETQGLWFYMDNNDAIYSGCMQIASDGLHLVNTGGEMIKDEQDQPVYQRNEDDTEYLIDPDTGGYIKQWSLRGWWNYKMVVPSVPAGGAVYLRMSRDESVPDGEFTYDFKNKNNHAEGYVKNYFVQQKFQFDHMSTKATIGEEMTDICKFYQVKDVYPNATDGKDDYIVAIYNNGAQSNLTFTLNGWTLKKLSVSQDFKKVNDKGWASESRNRVIDPELTAYMTGYDLETCIVTGVNYDAKTVTLTRVHSSVSNSTGSGSNNNTTNNNGEYVMRALSDGVKGASIIHNKADGLVEILDIGTAENPKKGFHLFVPDMHDYTEGATNNQKSLTHEHSESNKNLFVAQVSAGTIPASSGDYTNYALSYKYYKLNPDGTKTGSQQVGDEAFYRIAYNTSTGGASSSGNQGYLPLLTSKMNPYYVENTGGNTGGNNGNTNPAKFTIVFEDAFGDVAPGITTTIDDALQQIDNGQLTIDNDAEWYNLNGQKLNGKPTSSGLYIVNGKKVLVK